MRGDDSWCVFLWQTGVVGCFASASLPLVCPFCGGREPVSRGTRVVWTLISTLGGALSLLSMLVVSVGIARGGPCAMVYSSSLQPQKTRFSRIYVLFVFSGTTNGKVSARGLLVYFSASEKLELEMSFAFEGALASYMSYHSPSSIWPAICVRYISIVINAQRWVVVVVSDYFSILYSTYL